MQSRVRSLCVVFVLAALAAAIPMMAAPAAAGAADVYAKLPLTFEANDGQVNNPAVRFLSRGPGHSLFLAPAEATLKLRGAEGSSVVRWQTVGGNRNARVVGESPLATKSNYFRGNDRSRWQTDVANFAKVRYEGVYPGIDVVYHGTHGQLEYDFVVAPKADPKRIRLAFDGADSMTIDATGALVLATASGDLVQPRPVVYQTVNGKRRIVEAGYAKLGAREIGFTLGKYDRNRELVIDPVVLYATYWGGSLYEGGYAMAIDSSNNVYLSGLVESTDFPTVNAIQSSNAFDYEAFAMKINAAGTSVVYATYLGGTGHSEYGMGLAVDSSNNVYIVGATNSTDFPGTSGSAIQSSNGGGTRDGFATKINAAGNAITYSTYLGGNADEIAWGVAVDGSGNAHVVGTTQSSNFPVSNALQSSHGGGTDDGFLVKINAAGTAVAFSTYIGGSGGDGANDIEIDGSGNLYVAGPTNSANFPGVNGSSLQSTHAGNGDGYLLKLNSSASSILNSTYYGGTGGESIYAFELDASGNIVFGGTTDGSSLPGISGSSIQSTFAGVYDVFVGKMNAAMTAMTWATFLGGSDYDQLANSGIALDSSGNVYVAGGTLSTTYPGVTGTSMQPSNGGGVDAMYTKINAAGTSILWSTFYGGSDTDIAYTLAVDSAGNAYSTGITASSNLPGITGSSIDGSYAGGDGDAYVIKLGNPGNPVITSVSPTSGRAGDSITITGYNFDNHQGAGGLAWLGSKNAATIVSWSNNTVVATIASGAVTGSAFIKQNGVWSNGVAFTVRTPVITSVTPTTARAGDQITITGNYFGTSGTAAQVWLGNKAAGTIVSWSDTQVVATVASGASSGTVQVQAGGVWYNYGSFTVITPSISSISPTSGPVGTNVTITGTGFGATRGSGNVWLGGKNATNIVSWSDTQVVATVPTGATTSGTQVYQNGVWSNSITFTVTP
jgi:hypothetical protein